MFDVLVELLVCPCSLCGVEIAAADDMAVSRIEVESIRDIVNIAEWEVLYTAKVSICSMKRGEVRLFSLGRPDSGS